MASSTIDHPELKRVAKGLNQNRKVRVIAKIRSSTGHQSDEDLKSSWISVKKPDGDSSESVTISFGDQPASRKESYELDYCYDQNENVENIFEREVKSLISGVFDGRNATVIAYGARGSGKTSVIQGSIEKPGLASLSMDEFLLMTKEKGKSVSISFYEVYVDHVYDLLDSKRPAVLVLDDGQGKIQLKGLSRIPVKSMSDFYGLYFAGSNSLKQGQKMATEPPHRSHRGLIVHISSPDEPLDTRVVAKMNFVDMAGYEDARRKSSDGSSLVENSKINKSIYAMLNVASALNGNESHVPYRESKLTRILQDSLGVQSRILMITCLNATFCQDSIYMANLAARSCQVIKRVVSDSNRKNKSLTSTVAHSSVRNPIPKSVFATVKKQTVSQSAFAVKKQTVSQSAFSVKKPSLSTASGMKGRKLFDDTSRSRKLDKEIHLPSSLNHGEPTSAVDQGSSLPSAPKPEESSTALEKPQEWSIVATSSPVETTILTEDVFIGKQDPEIIEGSIEVLSFTGEGQNIEGKNCAMVNIDDLQVENTPEVKSTTSVFPVKSPNFGKENNSFVVNEDSSPPISARLRELSNNLRLFCSTTPSSLKIPDTDAPSILVSSDVMEPRTPVMEQTMQVYDEQHVANLNTPWETYSKRSSGMKNSLVKDYLKFLNTANKEELKKLKGIGEKRALSIIELREESPEPFKSLDDLMEIGLSAKQIKGLMKKEVGELLFN